MSYIQMIEEQDYSASARYDRFQGFDRGDLDRNECNTGEVVIGRMYCFHGKVEIVETYCEYDSWFYVRVNGKAVTEWFDNKEQAVIVGRWWIAGCNA